MSKWSWLLLALMLGGVALAFVLRNGDDAVDMEDMGPLEIGEDTTRVEGPIVGERVDFLAVLNADEPPSAADNAALPTLRVLGTSAIVANRTAVLSRLDAPRGMPATGTFAPASEDVVEALDLTNPMVDAPDRRVDNAEITAWIDGNRDALDALVEGSRRSRLWWPVVRNPENQTLELAVPPHRLTDALEALAIRAQIAREGGDLMAAWRDVQALLRWSQLISQLPSTLSRLVGAGVHASAMDALQALFEQTEPDVAFCADVVRTLTAVPPPRDVVPDVDVYDRLFVIDAFITQSRETDGRGLNPALRAINNRLDDVLAIAREPDGQTAERLDAYADARAAQMKHLREEMRRKTGTVKYAGEAILSGGRSVSRMAGEILAHMVVVTVPALVKRVHRNVTRRNIVTLAAALRIHAARHGAFPPTLDALTPTPLARVPAKALSGDAIAYERTEDGCRVGDEDWSIVLR